MKECLGAQELLIGVRIDLAVVHQIFAGLQTKRHPQRRSDGAGNLFLHREHVRQLAIVILRPDMRAVIGLDQLHGDLSGNRRRARPLP